MVAGKPNDVLDGDIMQNHGNVAELRWWLKNSQEAFAKARTNEERASELEFQAAIMSDIAKLECR